MEPIRILQFGLGNRCFGTENAILNLYRNIDRSRYQFDFLVDHDYQKVEYEDEVTALGGHIYRQYFRLNEAKRPDYISPSGFWRMHPEIQGGIHMNLQSYGAHNIQLIVAAKKAGLPIRIIHMRNVPQGTQVGWKLKLNHMLVRPLAGHYSNKNLACSLHAGRWGGLEGKQFEVFPSAIDINKFAYDLRVRDRIRDENGLTNDMVLGFAGRFEPQKNPEFLLRVLQEVNKRRSNVALVLLGEGGLEERLKRQAEEMNLKNIVFKGKVDNVHEWAQAFDALLLPSRYEGLGTVLIEAQASGLTCFASDHVPREAAVTSKCFFLGIEDPKPWADAILDMDLSYDRSREWERVMATGYNVRESVKRIESIYDELLRGRTE